MINNKLIAEFMGAASYPPNDYDMFGILDFLEQEDEHFYTVDKMLFHEDWNWLMPVIHKCYQEHMSNSIAVAVMTCNIETAYFSIIHFIEEYNNSL